MSFKIRRMFPDFYPSITGSLTIAGYNKNPVDSRSEKDEAKQAGFCPEG